MKYDTCITIFGGTGDLTFRKLLPALYTMSRTRKLPARSKILLIGRRDYDTASYTALARDWIRRFSRLPYSEESFADFAGHLEYYRMDFSDGTAYEGLEQSYEAMQAAAHIFYLAVAPRFFSVIAAGLKTFSNLTEGKIIIEKPFGETLSSAKELNRQLESCFGPENIYRIDHYLGKEMIRNIQTIRFSNPVFANAWNGEMIEAVEISALEDVGVENRGGYYDASGALKDMVQNHLFQILSILAMERPGAFTSEEMHARQLEVLRALKPVTPEDLEQSLILGQYDGYRSEPLVSPESGTETYACMRLFIDNDRWNGTPFYIRTGKKTGLRETEVAVIFRRPNPETEPDILLIKIQPTEGIYLRFNIKRPGDSEEVMTASMDFCQNCILENQVNTPEAYERLLTACIKGERSWFSQWDQIEISWNYIEQLKQLAASRNLPLYPYLPGTRGPREAETLLNAFGHHWLE